MKKKLIDISNHDDHGAEYDGDFSPCPPGAEVAVNGFAKPLDFHTEGQAAYLADRYDCIHPYGSGSEECSYPKKIEMLWSGGAADGTVHYSAELSESETFDHIIFPEEISNGCCLINLFLGKRYYYRIIGNCDTKRFISASGDFQTSALPPRNLLIEGATNFRDIGGWLTEDGQMIRQGLLYRGGRITDNFTGEQYVTDRGLAEMIKLGIATEIDLRRQDDKESGLITASILPNAVYHIYSMGYYGDMIDGNADAIRSCFAVFADRKNYPIYLHCGIGTDRTGLIVFLLEGLLGLSYEDTCREYLFSNFGEICGPRAESNLTDYNERVTSSDGCCRAEKFYRFLHEHLGIPAEILDGIRKIFLMPTGKNSSDD